MLFVLGFPLTAWKHWMKLASEEKKILLRLGAIVCASSLHSMIATRMLAC